MTEDQLLGAILELSKYCGARVAHFRPAKTNAGWRTAVSGDGKGWPDLFIVTRDHRALVRELKTRTGRLSADQDLWIGELEAAGINVAVWREADLASGRILSELRGAT